MGCALLARPGRPGLVFNEGSGALPSLVNFKYWKWDGCAHNNIMIHTNLFSGNSIYFITAFLANASISVLRFYNTISRLLWA